MSLLYQIQRDVQHRAEEITSTQPDWPCRKGCDDCCRRLAAVPIVTRPEWQAIVVALHSLPGDIAEAARQRIRESAACTRPVTCPLLDTGNGTCLIYQERPVACRTYGFYADRQYVLGCERIEAIWEENFAVVWGNHAAVENRLSALGESRPLFAWLAE